MQLALNGLKADDPGINNDILKQMMMETDWEGKYVHERYLGTY